MPRTTRDPDARRWLAAYGMRDAVAVPLNGGTGIVGVLVVADRRGDVRTFEKNDVLLLETVANQAGVALRNGELIGQLRHESLHDALTGLPNRTHLQRRLGSALDDVLSRPHDRRCRHDPRPRRLQGGQRHPRAPAGRPAARRGGRAADRGGRRGRLRRAARRRRVRRSWCPDTGDEDRGAPHRAPGAAVPRAAGVAGRARGGGRRLDGHRPGPRARRRPGRPAQAGRHGDVRRQDLDPRPAALRARARHEQSPPADAGLRAARRAAERRDPGPRPAAGPARPTARSSGSRRWPAGATPSWATSPPTSSSPSPSAAV